MFYCCLQKLQMRFWLAIEFIVLLYCYFFSLEAGTKFVTGNFVPWVTKLRFVCEKNTELRSGIGFTSLKKKHKVFLINQGYYSCDLN